MVVSSQQQPEPPAATTAAMPSKSSNLEQHPFTISNEIVEEFVRKWQSGFDSIQNFQDAAAVESDAEMLLGIVHTMRSQVTKAMDPCFKARLHVPRSPRIDRVYRKRALEQERITHNYSIESGSASASYIWHRPSMEDVDRQVADEKVMRVLIPGCWDCMHAGHFNAIRQAKMTFMKPGIDVVLIVAVHSSDGIAGQKGPPVLSDDERLAIVKAVKWVDEIVTLVPYMPMTPAFLDSVKADFVVHGDDLPVHKGSGTGMYSESIEMGRCKIIKRTEGVSTTNIIGRLLTMSQPDDRPPPPEEIAGHQGFLSTSQRLSLFRQTATDLPPKLLSDARRVVYVSGVFDMLHAGHVAFLQKAASMGDFLLVGLYDDVNAATREGKVIMSMHERALCVMALECVNDVVFDAPLVATEEMLKSLNVSAVVSGTTQIQRQEPVAEAMGILRRIDSQAELTIEMIAERVCHRRLQYIKRNETCGKKESDYKARKQYVPEA